MYVEEKCTDCQITLCLKCLGFFFSYWIFFLLTALNSLLNTGFVTKQSLIHQIFYHICSLGNCVIVVSMIGYFPYISMLSLKEIEHLLKLDFN